MIKYVEKRNSTSQKPNIVNFDISKIMIAITKTFKELGLYTQENIEVISSISKKVKRELNKLDKETVSVEEIQDIVEKVLIKGNYDNIAKAYILYREERNQIRNAKSRLMKDLAQITFSDAKDSDIKRENANVDGNTAMGQMLQYGSATSKEFAKNFIINKDHSYAHQIGDIHIHDMDFLSMGTLTCAQIDLSKLFKNGFSTGHGFLREPNDILSYSALAAIAIQSNQNDEHGGQSIPAFDYYMAPGVKKTFRKKLRDNVSKFIELNCDELNNLEEIARNIISEFGEINSIIFSTDDKVRLINLCEKYLSGTGIDYDKLIQFSLTHSNKETEKQTYQAMEAFIHNLNTMNSRAGAQVPFSSINFGTDISPEGRMVSKNLLLAAEAGLGKGETAIFPITIFKVKSGINLNSDDPNYDLFKLACRVSSKRLFPNFGFIDAPFNLKYYKEGDYNTEVTYMGCRTRVLGNVNGDEIVTGRGNLSFTTLNLPRLGIKYGIMQGVRDKADLVGFYKELDEKIELIVNQLLERYKLQSMKKVKNFPFLMGQGVWMDSEKLSPEDTLEEVIKHGSLTLGFIGLAETLIGLTGLHHGESADSQKLGIEIIEHMKEKMDEYSTQYNLNFTLIATPAEGLSGRFTKLDKDRYGEITGITDKDYYTNSFHVPVYYKTSVFEKINIEAPYHALTNAGHITYVELDGDTSNNLEAFESIIKAMAASGIGYGSINHPVDRDPVCGFTGVIGDSCPSCGRNEDDIKFERIRRITGYLVGTVDRFNNAKKSEEKARVKHIPRQ